jgi:aspartate/methionine/tyrosine aminotransferase
VQRAGQAAIEGGEPPIQSAVERLHRARDLLSTRLAALPGIEAAPPPGAMYLFFRLAGMSDSLTMAKRLVAEAGLGLAPGVAFGPEGEGYLRWCFAASEPLLERGIERLAKFLRA